MCCVAFTSDPIGIPILSPTHKLIPQETETLLSQGLGEYICNLLSRINGLDDDIFITNKWSEMMVLDGNVLCPGSKLWDLCNCDAAFIVLTDSATEYWISS